MYTVAIVDDEQNIRETVSYALTKEGYKTLEFANGQEAWDVLQHNLPDLIILDIIMPMMDGLQLCRKLRGISEGLPIIFLTSKDEEFDRVLGLEIGADDYLCKPFSMRELVTRVKVLFRRFMLGSREEENAQCLTVDSLHLDLLRYTVKWKGNALPLTITEFMLLQSLIKKPGIVKTRDQLMEEAYPDNIYVSDRTIDSHIKRLRKKFTAVDDSFSHIETVYGLGYRYRLECNP
jgi:two-component system response regulator ChvI